MTSAELEIAIKDLAFDVYHFRCYSRLYRDGTLASCAPIVQQAVLYALLLHMRVLLGFFGKNGRKAKKDREDDCWVEDFRQFPGVEAAFSAGTLSAVPERYDLLITNLHKRLAHFTTVRWEKPAPDMEFYASYFKEIDSIIDAFEKGLPMDLREAFVRTLETWSKSHPATLNRP